MTTQFVGDYLEEKIKVNPNYIVCTYFDFRVRKNQPEEEIFDFLNLSKKNMGYKVYLKGEKYIYNNITKIVKDNELFVAIKS